MEEINGMILVGAGHMSTDGFRLSDEESDIDPNAPAFPDFKTLMSFTTEFKTEGPMDTRLYHIFFGERAPRAHRYAWARYRKQVNKGMRARYREQQRAAIGLKK